MSIVIWIVTVVVALAFIGAGGMKLATPKAKLAENPQMGWTEDFSENGIKGIGALEVLGGLGLLLPGLLGIATVLVPLAGIGLFLVMVGAVVTHARRGETSSIAPPAVLGVLALLVAVLRFGPYAF